MLPKGRSGGDPLEAGQVETETYLSRLAGRAKEEGIRTETYVASGPVAQALAMPTRELDADLLVMSTHGRSGVSRFMFGSKPARRSSWRRGRSFCCARRRWLPVRLPR